VHSTTTHGLILHKVVGDCSTSIEALNLTPGSGLLDGASLENDKKIVFGIREETW